MTQAQIQRVPRGEGAPNDAFALAGCMGRCQNALCVVNLRQCTSEPEVDEEQEQSEEAAKEAPSEEAAKEAPSKAPSKDATADDKDAKAGDKDVYEYEKKYKDGKEDAEGDDAFYLFDKYGKKQYEEKKRYEYEQEKEHEKEYEKKDDYKDDDKDLAAYKPPSKRRHGLRRDRYMYSS